MLCAFCAEEKDLITPVPHKQVSGLTQVLACRQCAAERGLWCNNCGWAKTALADRGNPVCLYCIENEFDERRHDADSIRENLQDCMRQDAWMELADKATHQPLYVDEGLNPSILRLLITRAHIESVSVEEIIRSLSPSAVATQA